MRSFLKIKSSQNGKNTLSFIDIGKSCLSCEVFTSIICLLMLFPENKILAKISESTVYIQAQLVKGSHTLTANYHIYSNEFPIYNKSLEVLNLHEG